MQGHYELNEQRRRRIGPEAAKNSDRRQREGFFEKYLSGDAILDIGYRGGDPDSEPITERAIGIELDYPGYDGKTLPFASDSQGAVFASHVLEHIEDWSGALSDWYRVLKIGGHLIIAVPHRDLYERKARLPSSFNGDHKRFYTPALLLAEIEAALPVGGYRIRSLKDVDEGFDYAVPPGQHAAGCYEIELVLQKIAIPCYADALRPSPVTHAIVAFYGTLLRQAMAARGQPGVIEQIQESLSSLPLPPFPLLHGDLRETVGAYDYEGLPSEDLCQILGPVIARAPFDEHWYAMHYPDIAEAISENRLNSARQHYIKVGYFEGRLACTQDLIFG